MESQGNVPQLKMERGDQEVGGKERRKGEEGKEGRREGEREEGHWSQPPHGHFIL